MKHILLLLLLCLISNSIMAVTYTFTGTADWDTAANWSPSYPSTNISAGNVAIISAGSICTIPAGTTIVDEGLVTNLGQLDIIGGLFIPVGQFDNTGITNNRGDITSFGGIINNNGTLHNFNIFGNIGFFYNNMFLDNSGTITNDHIFQINAGQIINSGTLTNNETLNNNGGLFTNSGRIDNLVIGPFNHNLGTFTNTTTGIFNNSTTLFSNAIFINDGVINNSATYNMSSSNQHYGNGVVNGPFNQQGILSPADASIAGTHTITGNYSQNMSATAYRANINSNAGAGLGHDIVNISGSAALNGEIEIYFDNNFAPCAGEEYTIMTFGSMSGTPSIALFNTTGVLGTHISVTISATEVRVRVNAPLPNSVCVDVNVFLQGPFNGTDMDNDLGAASLIPTQEPYTNLAYVVTSNSNVTTANSIISSGAIDPVVDWILLELRPTATASSVTASSAALLLKSGKIVDVNGSSPVSFGTVSSGTYHLAVRHRNHLGVMTNTALVNVP